MRRKKLYTELLKTGDLFDMYSGMTGEWSEDSIKFNEQQDALETFSNKIDIDGEFID